MRKSCKPLRELALLQSSLKSSRDRSLLLALSKLPPECEFGVDESTYAHSKPKSQPLAEKKMPNFVSKRSP